MGPHLLPQNNVNFCGLRLLVPSQPAMGYAHLATHHALASCIGLHFMHANKLDWNIWRVAVSVNYVHHGAINASRRVFVQLG